MGIADKAISGITQFAQDAQQSAPLASFQQVQQQVPLKYPQTMQQPYSPVSTYVPTVDTNQSNLLGDMFANIAKNAYNSEPGQYTINKFVDAVQPLSEYAGDKDASALDIAGGAFNTALNLLDTPYQLAGGAIDSAYDDLIGDITGTSDAFSDQDITNALNIITAIGVPGLGLAKGIGSLKNLYNVSKFEKAMNAPRRTTFDDAVNTISGHIGAYGESDGAKRAAAQFGKYTKEDLLNDVPAPSEITLGDRTIGISRDGLLRRLERNKMKSPTPIYRGGNIYDGWFYTPDKRIAKTYDENIHKLPKGTLIAPGKWYNSLSRGDRNIPGREVIINPDWLNI